MVLINTGRERQCKDSLGGLDKIYLFKHNYYTRSQITLNNNVLITYPDTTIYEFEVNNQPNVNQKQTEDAGGKSYDINIDIDLAKEVGYSFQKYLNFDVNIIVKDRLGIYRFLGNRNGLTCSNINYGTGGSKSDFSGLKLSFEGKEQNEAWFINNLNAAGFTISGEVPAMDNALLLQNNDFFILQNNDNLILQNG